MQEGAGEHHGAPRRRLEAARAVLGKADLAAVELGIEVDRDRKPAVCCSLRGIVAMWGKMAAVLGAVAAYQIALHPGRLVLVGLDKLGRHAAREPLLDLPND